VIAVAAGASGAGAGTQSVGPYVVLSDNLYIQPSFTFGVTAGEASQFVGRSHWTAWGRSGAVADTTLFTDSCKPSCKFGHYLQQPAKIRLFGLATCQGKAVFSDFVVVDPSGEPVVQGKFRSLGNMKKC